MPEKLYATLKTSKGDIVCQLYTKEAPKTVENFVGLATGKIEWSHPETREKSTQPLYSGTIFHRVIPDFMIQGGDPLGKGIGGPGYQFEDEIDANLAFNRPGRLAMANSGPGTNGSQFFITIAPTTWLNGKHTIFGQVMKGQEIVDEISLVKRDGSDMPLEPITIKEIIISDKI